MPDSTIIRSQCSVAYLRSGLIHVKTPGDALIALDLALLRPAGACGARARCAGDAEGVLVVPPVRRRLLSGSCASR